MTPTCDECGILPADESDLIGMCAGCRERYFPSEDKMSVSSEYHQFLARKSQVSGMAGFDPIWMPEFLFPFQRRLTEWAIRKGRAALFANCGLGKTPMQLVWAENVVRHTNKPVLLVTPLAVGIQTVAESAKFGIEATRTRDGVMSDEPKIFVTNYEQLHKYDPSRFAGLVCDESSAIKDFKSERKNAVVEFSRQLSYRLLCTATAAPNDYHELGTSSEALGYLGFRDMITQFFKPIETKGRRWADHVGTKYRFRGHAEQPFWSWVCSWAMSLQKPSDLGFEDGKFILPELRETDHIVKTAKPRPGQLFTVAAQNMREEKAERRHSIRERCEKAAELADAVSGPSALWCELNQEGDLLEDMLDDCVQVSGSMSDDEKEEALMAFSSGQIRRIVTKPKIGAWGMNWQHCSNVISFPSHSFEQYYQLVRRCYRFGQEKPVDVHRVICEGEENVLASINRKMIQSQQMFQSIVAHMKDAMYLVSADYFSNQEEIPSWL